MKITHIITGLNTGGAEMMLYKMLSVMDRKKYLSEVISLTDIGPIGIQIESQGVPIHALGMRRGIPSLLAVLKLAIWLRRSKPDIVQTWLYHADLIGGIAAKLAGGISVIWGIHSSNRDSRIIKRRTVWIKRSCAWLSRRLPKKIVCCSEGVKEVHEHIGYDIAKMTVIPNGIDLSVFKPDSVARASIRKELGIPEEALIIGLVARFDPQKDHRNFIEAAGMFYVGFSNVHFLLCGDGIDWDNRMLRRWINDAKVQNCFHLLGQRRDVERVTAALDIATSSSFGESFSLTVGEAMACGIPCVATNTDGPVSLLAGCGWIVPIHDSRALCEAWRNILEISDDSRKKRIDAAKARVQKHFSLGVMVERYQHLYTELNENC